MEQARHISRTTHLALVTFVLREFLQHEVDELLLLGHLDGALLGLGREHLLVRLGHLGLLAGPRRNAPILLSLALGLELLTPQ